MHVPFLILQGQLGFGVEITFGTVSSFELVYGTLSVGLNRGKRGIIKKAFGGLVLFWVTSSPRGMPMA